MSADTPAGRMADDVRPPIDVVDGTDGAAGTFVFVLGASANFIIPAKWRGRYVDVQCDGGTGLYIVCGGDAVAANEATVSTVAANVITFKSGSCMKVEPANTKPYKMPSASEAAVTRFALKGAGTARIALSTGDGNA